MIGAGVRIRFDDNALMNYAAWAEARGFAETKPALQMYLDEFGGRDEFLRRQARGKDIHRLISQWVRGELEGPAVPAEDRRYAAALMSWAEEHEMIPDPNSSERLTCHPELDYAGRIDCQVHDAGGNRVLVEFKTRDVTAIGRRPEVGAADHLQLGMLLLAEARCGDACSRGMIVYLGEDATYASISCRANSTMVEALLSWAPQAQRLLDALRTQGASSEMVLQIADEHWTRWEHPEIVESDTPMDAIDEAWGYLEPE